MALAATIYMSLLGRSGLREVAELCYHKAHYAAQQIAGLEGYKLITQQPFFNEFVIECPKNVSVINQHMLEHGLIGGFDLEKNQSEIEEPDVNRCNRDEQPRRNRPAIRFT